MVPSISDFKEVINGPLLLSKRVDGGVSEKVLGRQRGAKIIRERVLGPWVSGAVTLDLLVLLALLSLGMVGVIVWSLPHLGLSLIALSSAFPLCRLPCFCRSLPFAHCSFLLLPGMWGSLCRAQGSACWLPLLHLFSWLPWAPLQSGGGQPYRSSLPRVLRRNQNKSTLPSILSIVISGSSGFGLEKGISEPTCLFLSPFLPKNPPGYRKAFLLILLPMAATLVLFPSNAQNWVLKNQP